MGHAIANTFKSIMGSSVTTIAGFAALCFMTFALGRDLGLVMAKGVMIGVVCCVTILPSLILIFDRAIEKTKHRPIIRGLDRPSAFITKHYKVWLVIFLALLLPAVYGNNHTEIYYNISQSLPQTLPSNVANKKLEDTFDMSVMHIVMVDKDMEHNDKNQMIGEMEEVDGVKWTIGMSSLIGPSIPDEMIPSDIRSMLQGDQYELIFVCSEYASATDEGNAQIAKLDEIVKTYDENGMVIGEAPLMKDLEDVTDIDLQNVNLVSILAIFAIILIIFRSISLPVILVAVIEFAIMVNMAIPYYQGISLPFVASIVVGTIQLGATVDYAILMTSRYQKERQKGHDKQEAIAIAHKASMPSIITSGLSFFAATFGIACYSQIDMIGSICTLLSRGAMISMIVVILVLPAMFILLDPVICHTSVGFLGKKNKKK
jgi:predicted RND superfamily exporter protein